MLLRIAALALPAAALLLAGLATARADDPKETPDSALDFTLKDIDGNPVDLERYKGDVLLIVNVASFCGNTPQYAGLEDLYEKYKDRGFAVLAFPANEFGQQEPGSDEEIKAFCTKNYGVTFPVFSKIVVKGQGIHPLYQYLTQQPTEPKASGDISWNFEKFLVDSNGKVVARFEPKTQPDDPKVIAAIEEALKQEK